MKRTLVLMVMLFVGACQPDDPRRVGGQEDVPAASGSGAEAGNSGREVQPVRHQVFQQIREDSAPPRETIHLLIQADADRDELRVTLQDVLNRRAEEDGSLVAIRAIGYVGIASGAKPNEANLTPIAWAEWLPPDGWYEADADSRDELHRVYFYHGSPPPWQ